MNELRIWFEPDLVARLELVTLAEHRDDVLAAELGDHLDFRAGRLDHLDLGLGAVVGDGEMLGPDAVDRGAAVGCRPAPRPAASARRPGLRIPRCR